MSNLKNTVEGERYRLCAQSSGPKPLESLKSQEQLSFCWTLAKPEGTHNNTPSKGFIICMELVNAPLNL